MTIIPRQSPAPLKHLSHIFPLQISLCSASPSTLTLHLHLALFSSAHRKLLYQLEGEGMAVNSGVAESTHGKRWTRLSPAEWWLRVDNPTEQCHDILVETNMGTDGSSTSRTAWGIFFFSTYRGIDEVSSRNRCRMERVLASGTAGFPQVPQLVS